MMAKREYDNPVDEILDRTRRMETKVTKLLDHVGLNDDGMRPQWINNTLHIPSINISLKDILLVIPEYWPQQVALMLDGVCVGYVQTSTISET